MLTERDWERVHRKIRLGERMRFARKRAAWAEGITWTVGR